MAKDAQPLGRFGQSAKSRSPATIFTGHLPVPAPVQEGLPDTVRALESGRLAGLISFQVITTSLAAHSQRRVELTVFLLMRFLSKAAYPNGYSLQGRSKTNIYHLAFIL
jgi:hypothetical protein